MIGEASPNLHMSMDSIFEYNTSSVKALRKDVMSHEKAVIERSKRLQKSRIMEVEAERLKSKY